MDLTAWDVGVIEVSRKGEYLECAFLEGLSRVIC